VPESAFYAINLDNPFFTDSVRQIAAEQFLPIQPGLVGFGLVRRFEELGSRVIDRQRDYLRWVLGVRGALTDTWDFDAWAVYTDGDEKEFQRNGLSRSRLAQGVLVDPVSRQCFDPGGGCVPVNLFGPGAISPEAADYLRAAPFTNLTNREQKLISAFVTGSPIDSWAGPIDVALGLEWRSDSVDFQADSAFANGDAAGYRPESAIRGEETVWEVYGEAVVPLLADRRGARYLGLELGGRYSDYDNAGSVESWKLGLQWEVIDGVRFRTIVQRSVRAPNLAEAFQEQVVNTSSFVGPNTFRDPCSASADPVGNNNGERCIVQGVPADQLGVYEATAFFPTDFIFGGNPNLVPEEADTFTAGVVLALPATPRLEIAIDYFDLEVTDTIGTIDAAAICFDPANAAGLFCDNIRRDPATFNITEVFEPTSNRGTSRVEGIDTQLTWTSDLPAWAAVGDAAADLRVNLVWTHLLSRIVQENPVSTPIECAGAFGWPCYLDFSGETFPEDRITGNFLYGAGRFDANLTWRWISGSDNAAPIGAELIGLPAPELAIPSIGSKNYFDLSLAYDLTEEVRAVLNIVNLLDEDPPFVADGSFSNNVDTTLYDIFGRSYQLALLLRF
jgi:outer membrane receptor protein involved in Fe transport